MNKDSRNERPRGALSQMSLGCYCMFISMFFFFHTNSRPSALTAKPSLPKDPVTCKVTFTPRARRLCGRSGHLHSLVARMPRLDQAWPTPTPRRPRRSKLSNLHAAYLYAATRSMHKVPSRLAIAASRAVASGSVLIVDNRGGWKIQVEDGRTGWLCDNDREFVYKASRCAFEEEERQAMRLAARDRLDADWGLEAGIRSWEAVFVEWATLK